MQVTRGMRRRSEKLARHRERLPADALIAGVDLGKRHSVVLFVRAADRARVGRLDIGSDPAGWARLIAQGRALADDGGTGPLVVAMEPTSHFWKPLARAARAEGVPYVLVQGFVVAHARELGDLTRDKTDLRDAGLIAELAAELRFTDTRLPEGPWAESALLVETRDARRIERAAALQEVRALLELAWPELLEAAGYGWMRGQIRGLGDPTLAALLALTGDPTRYDDARCLVKLAGTNPTARSSGEVEAAGGIHRRGRPLLRYLAYQAAVTLVRHEPEYQRRFAELTASTRDHRLAPKQAYVALGNRLLRTLWSMAVHGTDYDPAIARGEVRPLPHAS